VRIERRAGMPDPGRFGSIFFGLAGALGGADATAEAAADAAVIATLGAPSVAEPDAPAEPPFGDRFAVVVALGTVVCAAPPAGPAFLPHPHPPDPQPDLGAALGIGSAAAIDAE
jgi:hypothetical protein